MDALTDTAVLAPPRTEIHPSAVIARGAEIGTGVRIGPFCTIGADVIIEDGAELMSHVVVDGHTRIGADTLVYPFCTIGLAPQDLKYRGEPTRCEIGPRTQIREHCTIHRGSVGAHGITSIGADCLLMAVVHVAHDCTLGDHVIMANNSVMGGHVTIGDYAVVGGAVAIHQFTRIGRASMIGGVSVVVNDLIPFGSALGNRAKLTGLNVVGLRRRGFDKVQIRNLHAAFALLFRGPGVFADRLVETREKYGADALVAEVLTFVDSVGPRGLLHAD